MKLAQVRTLYRTTQWRAELPGMIVLGISQEEVKQPWKPALVLGYDLTADEELHPQTVSRCRQAAMAWFEGDADDIFLSSYLIQSGCLMAKLMKEEIVRRGVPEDRVHIVSPTEPTNTFSEVQVFLDAIKSFQVPEGHEVTPVAISSWYHVWRLKAVFTNLGRKLTCWRTTSSGTFIDVVLEAVKLAKEYLVPGIGRLSEVHLPPAYTSPSAT